MALVTKILEGTLSAGQTQITFTDSDIPNSLIRVYSTDPDLFPADQSISENILTITYEQQETTKYIAVELVKQGLIINDTLTSEATDEALSASKGKYLKDELDQVFLSVSSGKTLIAEAITDKGVETSATATFATMAENITAIPTGGAVGSLFRKITGAVQNSDTATASYNVSVAMPYTTITASNVFLDLIRCYYTGSTSYTSSTTVNSVNQSSELVNIGWQVQSGQSWQRFHLYYLEDTTKLKVLSDWTTYNNNNKTVEITLPTDAQNLNADDFIVDFKEVNTGSGASGTYTISKSITDGVLTIIMPVASSRTLKARILYAI